MALTINFFKFGLDNLEINTKFGGMYRGFFTSIRELGHEVNWVNNKSHKKADLLVVPVGGGQERNSAKAIKKFNGPIILYVPSAKEWFSKPFLKRW